MSRRVYGWMFAWLLMVGAAGAQQGTSEVRGRVLDSTGASLPGVTVTVKNQDTGMFRETLSGDNGAFIASALVPGRYEVSAALQGFKTFKRGDLQLEVGRTATIDVTMEVGGMEETVTVSAGTPLVDVTSKEIGGNITSETLVQLPSVNGNFIGFVGLLPGIVPSISTESFGSDSISANGQDPRNNNYTVDGGNNNDDVIGQRAGMQARTPIEAVQEFQVLTGQFDAEFGRTTGAVINAVIKNGTNIMHGSAFGFFQDSSMTTQGLPGEAARARQGRHQLPALGRDDRRAHREEPDALLPEPGALRDRSRQHGRLPDASGPERSADDRGIASGTRSCAATTSCRRTIPTTSAGCASSRRRRTRSCRRSSTTSTSSRPRWRRARSPTSTSRWPSTSTRC